MKNTAFTFLAIDDKEDNLNELHSFLNTVFPKMILLTTTTLIKGLDIYLKEKPDIFLLDADSQEMEDARACSKLKKDKSTKQIPIIVLTSQNTSKEKRVQILSAGADAFLSKPIDESELMAVVKAMLFMKKSEDFIVNEKILLERIIKNEIKQNAMISNIFDVIAIMDINGTIKYKSPNITKYFGWKPEDLLGTNAWAKVHADDLTRIQYEFKFLLDHVNVAKTVEYRYECKDGSYKWIELTAINRKNDPIIQGILMNYHDISERKQAEEKLRESVDRFKAVSENSHNAICIVSEQGRITWCNQAMEAMGNYTIKQLLEADSFISFIAPESVEFVVSNFTKFVLKEKYEHHYSFYFVRKDGKKRLCEKHMTDYKETSGVRSLAISMMDVTDRKIAEEALRESETKFRTLSEASSAGIFIHNGEYFEYVNKTTEITTGFSEKELRSMKFIDLIYPDDRTMVADIWQRRSAGEALPNSYECRLRKKDGGFLWADVSAKNIQLNGKNALIGTAFDITLRKIAEEQLIKAKDRAEESDRLKSVFLANMSHEIRTPMNAIIGFSDILLDPKIEESKRQKFAAIIQERTLDLLRIVEDILDVSKIEVGQLKIIDSNIILSNLLNDQYEYYQQKILSSDTKSKIKLKLSIPEKLKTCSFTSDRQRISQILINLLDNALKFTHAGVIELGCTSDDKTITFFVRDTGIGIPKEKQEMIFDRFRQADEALTSRQYGGTGLGLSIVKGLAKLLNGKIVIQSEVNKGSTFYFSLPLTQSKITDENHIVSTPVEYSLWKNKTLLIVEDNEMNALYLKELLSNKEMNLLFALNGKEALKHFRDNQNIDLVLMDIQLPDTNGLSLTETMKKENPSIVIIAQTAYATPEDIKECMNAGCNSYISKPINKIKLNALLNQYLIPK